jgi:hypothetical protein
VGKPPFTAETHGLLLVEIIQGPRLELSAVTPRTPPDVSALVQRSMAKERELRFAHAGEFADAVEKALARLGHRSMLSTRSGAEDFYRLLDGQRNVELPQASSTTGAVSMPTPSPSAQTPGGTTPQSQAISGLAERLSVPGVSKSPLPAALALLVAAVLVVGAMIAITRFISAPSASEPASSVAAQTAAASMSPLAPSRPDPVALPALAPPPAPVPSASVARPAGVAKLAGAAKPAGAARSPVSPVDRPQPKPSASATAKPKPVASPTPSARPVHHGVTSSGL